MSYFSSHLPGCSPGDPQVVLMKPDHFQGNQKSNTSPELQLLPSESNNHNNPIKVCCCCQNRDSSCSSTTTLSLKTESSPLTSVNLSHCSSKDVRYYPDCYHWSHQKSTVMSLDKHHTDHTVQLHKCDVAHQALVDIEFAIPHQHKSSSTPLPIENCQVPRNKSATAVIEVFRKKIRAEYREAEFLVVCDTQKERKLLINDLNNAQVTVVHVCSTSKNAADDKLRQCLRRFVENVGFPCAVMLVSSDINFATDLSDLKNRKKVHVILVHGPLASEALLLCSNEHYIYDNFLEEVPSLSHTFQKEVFPLTDVFLLVSNLPLHVPDYLIRQRVQQIAENCGGKMIHHNGNRGIIRFQKREAAQRARVRMEGEDVFGSKISLHFPQLLYPSVNCTDNLPVFSKSMLGSPYMHHLGPFPPPPNPALVAPPRLLDFHSRCGDGLADKEARFSADHVSRNEVEPELHNLDDMFHRAALDADGPNRWDYYRTPSEYLVEKTPQGHRRIRGAAHKVQHQLLTSPKTTEMSATSQHSEAMPVSNISFSSLVSAESKLASESGRSSYATTLPYSSSSSSQRSSPLFSSVAHVDLHVTNLDQSIGAKEMKTLLVNVFKQHVMVQNVTVHLQSDGHLAAVVRVPSVQDAQFCVSQLHRRKLGNKRIMIAYDQNGSMAGSGRSTPTPLQIRAQVNALLSEIPQRRLPLFKFRELYEQRYTTSVSLADLHRLRDILHVTDDAHGRCVVFLQQANQQVQQHMLSSSDSVSKDGTSRASSSEPELPISEMPRCPIHDSVSNGIAYGWAEPEPMPELPMVFATLHQISLHLHCLLQSHGGTIPLASVPRCYETEIGNLQISEDKGVPLEHLISCVKGVGIVSVAGHKRLQWSGKNEQTQDNEPLHSLNPSLMPQMSLLCRELVDLLKVAPQCRIPFSKFIPQYHHHFGRQCRVADYGYTRLIDLLESLPHVVQILGEGNRRYVTLSHRAQMKRFTSDLLRLLKAQASKQLAVSLFSAVYEKTFCRPFDSRDYGLCQLSDLLAQVAEASVVVMAAADGEEFIALPKREQTFEEMERTKQFAVEVVELLKHAPQCKLDFAKFIPAYHHNFGRQCRVADYGCTKLVELFEAIPETVQVFEMDNEIEKYVQLTTTQRLRILGEQITTLVRNHAGCRPLLLDSLPDAFRIHFGFALKPEQYQSTSLDELISKLRNHVQVTYSVRGAEVSLIDQNALSQSKNRVIRLLYPIPDGSILLRRFLELYKNMCGEECPLSFLTDHMDDIVTVDNEVNSEPVVRFVPLLLFARQVHILLNENEGRLPLLNFEASFLERFGVTCRPVNYGYSNTPSLLQAIPQFVSLRGKGPRRVLVINREIEELIPPSMPQAPKPSIKPPSHWLNQQPTGQQEECVDREKVTPNKNEIYEDLQQFFNSSTSSSLMYAPVPTFIPSLPWSPIFGLAMGLPMNVSNAYASTSGCASLATAACSYPYNYWLTSWPAPCTFSVPVNNAPNYPSPRASLAEIEDAASSGHGTPPPASVLPHPSFILSQGEEEGGKNPIKSRIAAQFCNPVAKRVD